MNGYPNQRLQGQILKTVSVDNKTSVSEMSVSTMEVQPVSQCQIRFLNAAAGYGELIVEVAGQMISNNLEFGRVSERVGISEGYQDVKITMVQSPGAVLLDKPFPFQNCMNSIAAIINTATGIDVMLFSEAVCRPEEGRACFRIANLSYTSPPVDIMVENGEMVFKDVRFKQMTEFVQADAGEYNFNVLLSTEAPEAQLNNRSNITPSPTTGEEEVITPEQPVEEGGYPAEEEPVYTFFYEEFEGGRKYTAFLIGNKNYEHTLRVETIEESIE